MGSFLNAATITLLEQGYAIGLDWLGKFARAIIEGVGIIGLGIIVFTLVLKAITLPFDIYQRVKMRKQNLIMKQMQPELEKLQKQYANDKQMYNQKMMELQKKNGIGILSACLPMIISLVILIVAFQGFRSYSNYANLSLFANMSESYNAAILENSVAGDDYILVEPEEGVYNLVLGKETVFENVLWQPGETLNSQFPELGTDVVYTMKESKATGKDNEEITVKYFIVTSNDPEKYIFYEYTPVTTRVIRSYQIDTDKIQAHPVAGPAIAATLAPSDDAEENIGDEISEDKLNKACREYVKGLGAQAAADYYNIKGNRPGFLWVKNVWYPDVSYKHPIPSYKDFSSSLNVKVTFPNVIGEDGKPWKPRLSQVISSEQYEDLVSGLKTEQKQPNGYFILIILSIGMMVASQLITMKSSKESNKYQTVDGQGAKTQKMMLFLMPMIYAIFAFMYSAAFSIYMVMSSLVAVLVTLLSNLILGRIFKKKEEEAFKEEHSQVPAWMKNRQYGKPRDKKDDKKEKRK